MGIIGWPMMYYGTGNPIIGFSLAALGLYCLGLGYSRLVSNLDPRRFRAAILAATLVLLLVFYTVGQIVSDPNGTYFPIPANARNVVRDGFTKEPIGREEFDTPNAPGTVVQSYRDYLQRSGWALLRSEPYDDLYWRVTTQDQRLDLTFSVNPALSGLTHVLIVVHYD